MLPNNLAEITADLQPADLDRLCRQLSDEVGRLCQIVAGYEIGVKAAVREHKKALAAAAFLNKDVATPSIVKLIIEADPEVVKVADKLEAAEALLSMGKAELDGRTAQYQAVKKLIDLKVQEVRTFRG